MAGKKSIIDLLPKAGSHNESPDFPFRFNRHVTGDYLATDQERNFKDRTEDDLCHQIENVEKPRPLIPPIGIPPPTAKELMRLKKNQPESAVDYCKPVEYQFLPIEIREPDLSEPAYQGKHSFTMPRLEGMHAPGSECGHILRPAGFSLPYPSDVYRFNRVTAYYPPSQCIRPNEGDLMCPHEYPKCQINHPCMPAAGTDTRMLSDVYRFNKVHQSTSCNPCKIATPYVCKSKAVKVLCPCTYKPRYPPSKPGRHFDFRYPSGATECKLPAHRRGHVPASCMTYYPGADEIVYLDKPRPSDCRMCFHDGCNCGGQGAANRSAGDNVVCGRQPQAYNSSIPNYNISTDVVGHPMSNSAFECSDASMYNNAPSTRLRSIPGTFSGDYANDRNCSLITGQSANRAMDVSPGCPPCAHSYFQTDYVCRPMYDRTYLLDCPEQDGPPANTYTFFGGFRSSRFRW